MAITTNKACLFVCAFPVRKGGWPFADESIATVIALPERGSAVVG